MEEFDRKIEKALHDFGEAYATLVDRDNNPNQGIRVNAYHELVQESASKILELAKEYARQEQPDVDIRKELGRVELMGSNNASDMQHIAIHFYELGLNARKEE